MYSNEEKKKNLIKAYGISSWDLEFLVGKKKQKHTKKDGLNSLEGIIEKTTSIVTSKCSTQRGWTIGSQKEPSTVTDSPQSKKKDENCQNSEAVTPSVVKGNDNRRNSQQTQLCAKKQKGTILVKINNTKPKERINNLPRPPSKGQPQTSFLATSTIPSSLSSSTKTHSALHNSAHSTLSINSSSSLATTANYFMVSLPPSFLCQKDGTPLDENDLIIGQLGEGQPFSLLSKKDEEERCKHFSVLRVPSFVGSFAIERTIRHILLELQWKEDQKQNQKASRFLWYCKVLSPQEISPLKATSSSSVSAARGQPTTFLNQLGNPHVLVTKKGLKNTLAMCSTCSGIAMNEKIRRKECPVCDFTNHFVPKTFSFDGVEDWRKFAEFNLSLVSVNFLFKTCIVFCFLAPLTAFEEGKSDDGQIMGCHQKYIHELLLSLLSKNSESLALVIESLERWHKKLLGEEGEWCGDFLEIRELWKKLNLRWGKKKRASSASIIRRVDPEDWGKKTLGKRLPAKELGDGDRKSYAFPTIQGALEERGDRENRLLEQKEVQECIFVEKAMNTFFSSTKEAVISNIYYCLMEGEFSLQSFGKHITSTLEKMQRILESERTTQWNIPEDHVLNSLSRLFFRFLCILHRVTWCKKFSQGGVSFQFGLAIESVLQSQDKNSIPKSLNDLDSNVFSQSPKNTLWVSKAVEGSKGVGVEVMRGIEEVVTSHHKTKMARVLQKYIENCDAVRLVNSEKMGDDTESVQQKKGQEEEGECYFKYDLRTWVLVKGEGEKTKGKDKSYSVFVYTKPYGRICKKVFSLEKTEDNRRHLSNWSLNKSVQENPSLFSTSLQLSTYAHDRFFSSSELLKVPSEVKIRQDEALMQAYCPNALFYISQLSPDNEVAFRWESEIFPKMKEAVKYTIERAIENGMTIEKNDFHLLGFDFLLDRAFNPWIIEVNFLPACDAREEELRQHVQKMSAGLLSIVLWDSSKSMEEFDWEKLV